MNRLGLIFLLSLFSIPFMGNGQNESCSRKHIPSFWKKDGDPWFLQDGRPDSMDVLHTDITITEVNDSKKRIKGSARILVVPLVQELDRMRFDLEGLKVTHVSLAEEPVPYNHRNGSLFISPEEGFRKGDTVTLKVDYKGEPIMDKTGWGGFYFRNGYAFNLGVGFGARPHSYGRVWFPCVDHFQERCTYDFRVHVDEEEKAVCSGVLKNVRKKGNKKVYEWSLEQMTPAYLVSIAVGDYVELKRSYESITGRSVPVRLFVAPEDSSNAVGSFKNLDKALQTYEESFGPYIWDRVGYVAVPFPSGAMEHVTNIAYPSAAVNGSTVKDDLLSHELSHHWWGDLVTCATPWDMWINEGMASYSEFLFMEGLKGKSGYRKARRRNHKKVVKTAHLRDGGEYRAVYGIPHAYTYGSHVYDKGADVVHTLRSFLGDSLFFHGMREVLRRNRFSSMNTCELGKELENITEEPVPEFFDQWLMKPGFPHIQVDSFSVEPGARVKVRVYLSQEPWQSETIYSRLPVPLTFKFDNGATRERVVELNDKRSRYSFTFNERPSMIGADLGGTLAQAQLTDTSTISIGGVYEFDHTSTRVNLEDKGVPLFLSVREHLTSPKGTSDLDTSLKVNKARYWSVDGVFPDELTDWSISFPFNGKEGKGIHPEREFFRDPGTVDEKGLKVFYRKGPGHPWESVEDISIRAGKNEKDGKGRFVVPDPGTGEYILVR